MICFNCDSAMTDIIAYQKSSIAIVQTKVVYCNNADKSCNLQFLHTKAIAALTQFCDFSVFLGGVPKGSTPLLSTLSVCFLSVFCAFSVCFLCVTENCC